MGLVFTNAVAEQILDPATQTSRFVVAWASGERKEGASICLPGRCVRPVDDEIVRRGFVRVPGAAQPYGSIGELVDRIRSHLRSLVVLPNDLEPIIPHYILYTWVFDRFDSAPYLHFIGDLGTGKTQALRVVGDLCYRAFVVAGGSSAPSIFRGLDRYRGTLVLDESDFFQKNDDHQEIMRLLRTGFQRGQPLMRVEGGHENWEVRPFEVFGPKLIAGRQPFPDEALESRCIPVHMRVNASLEGIQAQLSPDYEKRAAALQDQLLQWRLDNFSKVDLELATAPTVEGRLRQVFGPIAAVAQDAEARRALEQVAERSQVELTESRQGSPEGKVLAVLLRIASERAERPVKVHCKELIDCVPRAPTDAGRSKRVSAICRGFGLPVERDRDGAYVLFDQARAAHLLARYGLANAA